MCHSAKTDTHFQAYNCVYSKLDEKQLFNPLWGINQQEY